MTSPSVYTSFFTKRDKSLELAISYFGHNLSWHSSKDNLLIEQYSREVIMMLTIAM